MDWKNYDGATEKKIHRMSRTKKSLQVLSLWKSSIPVPSTTILHISKRIHLEYEECFQESELYELYIRTPSVQKKMTELEHILIQHGVHADRIKDILTDRNTLTRFIIPPGTKGVMKGNLFNRKVRERIEEIAFPSHFAVYFEKNQNISLPCSKYQTGISTTHSLEKRSLG